MNEVNATEASIFPGTPVCATQSNEIAPRFLTSLVVAECRHACEELADSISGSSIEEHDTINDCLAACDEYTGAAARESRHTMRYAIWCSEQCDNLRDACLRMDSPASRSAAKWLKAVSKQMNRELISLQRVSEVMDKEVTWDSVKEVMNKPIISFDPFGSGARSKVSGR